MLTELLVLPNAVTATPKKQQLGQHTCMSMSGWLGSTAHTKNNTDHVFFL